MPQKEASLISSEVNLENVSEDRRFIILKRKRLDNGKIATSHYLNKVVTTDEINSGEALEMTTIIIDGLKLKSLVERSI